MNIVKIKRAFVSMRWTFVTLLVCLINLGSARAGIEQRFDLLEIGAHTYRNVTITTKTKKYIFIMHSAGMSNIKVSDLSQELKDKLGYTAIEAAEAAKATNNSLSSWAKNTLQKMETPAIKQLEANFVTPGGAGKIDLRSPAVLMALSIAGLVYLLFCYCGALICRKTETEPGPLIWVPVLQIFPLLRAASMPAGWFFAFLVPVVNVIALVVWAINIAEARGKSGWVAFCLLLPLTNILAYAYLAFSGMPKKAKPAPRVELMTLETA